MMIATKALASATHQRHQRRSDLNSRSHQEFLDVFPAQGGGEVFFATDRRADNVAFAGLELEDFFFDGIARDELIAGDDSSLTDTMGAIGGLIFDCGIPPRIEMDDGIRAREVQTDAACLETDEEHGDRCS